VLAIPNQTPGLIERYGLTRIDVDRELWVIDPTGRRYAGVRAVNHILKALGGGWALLSRLYVLAPVRWIEDRLYRWVAEHRPLLSRLWGTKPPFDEPKTPW